MLKVVFPITYVSIAVCEVLRTLSMHFTSLKISFIPWFIWPDDNTFSIHVIIFEFSLVELARICEVILAITMELAINKVSLVISALKLEPAVAWFFAVYKLASIFDFIIVPALATIAMLLVIEPFSLIHRAISVNKYSVAICFSLFPVPLVDVVIRMSHSALAVKKFVFGHTLIRRAIRKNDDTKALPCLLVLAPMSLVFSLLTYTSLIW